MKRIGEFLLAVVLVPVFWAVVLIDAAWRRICGRPRNKLGLPADEDERKGNRR